MNVNGWNYQNAEDAYPLTCPACGKPIPNRSVVNGDIFYSPMWSDAADEMLAAIQRAFGIEDPMAHFLVCRACFLSLGELPPMDWLHKWIENNPKPVSRTVPNDSSAHEGRSTAAPALEGE